MSPLSLSSCVRLHSSTVLHQKRRKRGKRSSMCVSRWCVSKCSKKKKKEKREEPETKTRYTSKCSRSQREHPCTPRSVDKATEANSEPKTSPKNRKQRAQ